MVAVQSNLIPPGGCGFASIRVVSRLIEFSVVVIVLSFHAAVMLTKLHPGMLQVVTNHGSACPDLDACPVSQH